MGERHHASGLEAAAPDSATSSVIEPPLDLPALTLEETRIGLHLEGVTTRVEALGVRRTWLPGEHLCREGVCERSLHVLLNGRLAFPGGEFGPGAHTGEIGFLLGSPRTANVTAVGDCETLTIPFDALSRDPYAATLLLLGLARELPSRVRKFGLPKQAPENACDADHPAIVALAASLRGSSDTETARAIWDLVRRMPYRFGPWWLRASDTLRAGWGMCTTKSNLQVALCRAAGLEAGFAEFMGPSDLLVPLLPRHSRRKLRPKMRHIVAAVRLEGQWHVADSSYPDAVVEEFAKTFPVIGTLLPAQLEVGAPFHPIATVTGLDPFAVEVVEHINDSMARRSSHDVDTLEVMNLLLDRLQGLIVEEPRPLARARALADVAPVEAFGAALGASSLLAHDLFERIQEPA